MSTEIQTKWTEDEIAFLIENYQIIGAKGCSEKLKRSKGAIATKALKLNLQKSKRWEEWELNFLKENLKERGVEWCAKELNRTSGSVITKKQCVDGARNERITSWKQNEIDFLKENFSKKGALYCYEHMPNRTIESIRIKASRLNIIRNPEDKSNQEPRKKRENAPNGYSYCSCCDQILSVDYFYRKNSGGQYGDYLNEFCRSCSKEKARRSFRKNKSSARERYSKNPEKKMFDNLKGRSKKFNIEFDLEVSDIVIPEKCPVLGIPLIPFSSSDNSPSVDKFYPEKGYTKGNIFIISKRANRIKSNASTKEVEMLLNWMRKTEEEINNKDYL